MMTFVSGHSGPTGPNSLSLTGCLTQLFKCRRRSLSGYAEAIFHALPRDGLREGVSGGRLGSLVGQTPEGTVLLLDGQRWRFPVERRPLPYPQRLLFCTGKPAAPGLQWAGPSCAD